MHHHDDFFASKGYVTATVDYRSSLTSDFPASLAESKCAVRRMRAEAENLHVDPDRIPVIGNSAGGPLARELGGPTGVSLGAYPL